VLLVKLAGMSEFKSFPELFGVHSPTKFTNVVLHRGDELYYRTPGGAGFGPASERDPAAIREDVLEGYVSAEAAARDYRPLADAAP
jgi:N-methylhydantoinase B/oxoprolinase/acetone carboxylase alpha subunit